MEESNPTVCLSLDDEKVVGGAQGCKGKDVFQCNICMEHPTNSILTKCGHLFCWSCLHQWLQNMKKLCPVCKVRVGSGGITLIYGCQGGSSSKSSNDSTPPRPSAPLKHRRPRPLSGSMDATNVSFAPNSTPPSTHGFGYQMVTLNMTTLQGLLTSRVQMELAMQDLRMESLRSRAQVDFREIHASHPPSPIGWIAQASHEFARAFDPSPTHLDGLQLTVLRNFVSNILVGQGEYVPTVDDFGRSWLPYYEAQNPKASQHEHYNAFWEAWAMYFWRVAWSEAARCSEVGSTSIGSHQEPLRKSEREIEEMDAIENNRTLQERRVSRQMGRPSRSRTCWCQPY